MLLRQPPTVRRPFDFIEPRLPTQSCVRDSWEFLTQPYRKML
jgi:hypothetical protein